MIEIDVKDQSIILFTTQVLTLNCFGLLGFYYSMSEW